MFRVFTIGIRSCKFWLPFLIFSFVGISSLQASIDRLRHLIQTTNTAELGCALRATVGESVTLQEIHSLARETQYAPLARAARATEACLNLDTKIGMSLSELIQVAFFIETRLLSFVTEKKFYLKAKEVGLPRTIEYDPETGYRFIHLEMNNVPCVGGGAKKLVTKSILYDEQKPEVLARCEQTAKIAKEVKIAKKLQGISGIVETRAYTQRVEKGVTYHTLFCKLYKAGTIADVLNEGSYQFTLKEKLFISLNIVKGLEGMQKNRIVHKDLHVHNYLVNITKNHKTGKRVVDVVIADLGCASFAHKTKKARAQGDSAFTAPEGFLNKIEGKDYYRTDLFAAGCLLYRILYEKKPNWQESEYPKHAKTALTRYRRLFSLVDAATHTRRDELQAKEKRGIKLRPKERFELLILRMVHPNPEVRPTATEARKILEYLLK